MSTTALTHEEVRRTLRVWGKDLRQVQAILFPIEDDRLCLVQVFRSDAPSLEHLIFKNAEGVHIMTFHIRFTNALHVLNGVLILEGMIGVKKEITLSSLGL
jgi:hypothetical protein